MSDNEERHDAAHGAPVAEATDAAPQKVRQKLSKNKKLTIIVAAVAMVAIAGAGFWTWHMQPSFCNFLCHSPQDRYVESYYAGDPGTGITVHAQAGKNCLSCHEATVDTQLREVATWIGDGYNMTEDGFLVSDEQIATKEFCTRAGCHVWEDVVASTAGFAGNDEKYNPHASHQDGSITCNSCHKIHQKSQLYCAKCHDLKLPEGWEATRE